jgi:hypothetical protein
LFFAEDNPDGGGVVTVQAATLLPQDLKKGQGGILGFLNKITLKNSIQQMYEGLEAQGITPGEEVRFVPYKYIICTPRLTLSVKMIYVYYNLLNQ